MSDGNLIVKPMYWYKRTGRIIYLLLFSGSLITTVIQGVYRKPHFLGFIFLNLTIVLLGLWLEATLIQLSQLGTTYIETNKLTDSYELMERRENKEIYYVGETREDYIIYLIGATYTKNCKKTETVLEEKSHIEIPIVEITTIEKVSQPADNQYSVFSIIGEKVKTENIKITVKNKEKDIRRI